MPKDPRRPLELRIEMLATEEQAMALQDAIGEAICNDHRLHDGPCRIAWSMAVFAELTKRHKKAIKEHLGPVETWPNEEVNRSLGIAEDD